MGDRMQADDGETQNDVRADFAMLGYVDLDGLMRGKFVSAEKLASIAQKGSAMCSVVLGWDSRDGLYDNAYTGWDSGFADDAVRLAPKTRRRLPDGRDFHLLEFTGKGADLCPRRLAGRVVARGAEMGYGLRAGFEYELYAFRETAHSALAKGYRGLVPFSPTTGGYSVLRMMSNGDLFDGLMQLSRDLDTPLEGIHPEAGEGAMEFALAPCDGIAAADRAAIFKSFSKGWGQREGLMLCYMAKPVEGLPGCGGHLHMSLWQGDTPAFWDAEAADHLSPTARHFIGGQQKYMPELLAMLAPTINAFTRLAPGFWAPTAATWGFDNRTCALRAVGDGPKSLRVEHRPAAADANPYLVLAAALASGLAGIEDAIEPTEPTRCNAYEAALPAALRLPDSLTEAAVRLRGSQMARDWFGDRFVDHYATSREAEVAACRAAVSDWELNRYFEMI